MDKSLKIRIGVILCTILISAFCIFPIKLEIMGIHFKKDIGVNLGLDLKGGMHLTLRVES